MVLVAGLTPAWQQILLFDALSLGTVNRTRQVHWCGAGKVLNAARALFHLGGPCRVLTVVGGTTGNDIRQDFARLGIAAQWIEVAVPTRVCTTLLDAASHTVTELVPEAGVLAEGEQAAFREAFAVAAADASMVLLIGSLPPGTPVSFYRELLSGTRSRALLDVRGPELLEALAEKPFMVKPNREELQRTLGRPLDTEAELCAAMGEINERGAEWVVITDGRNPVHASTREQVYWLNPPARPVVNPIGCGDCLGAGIAWMLAQGKEPLEAIRYGMAVAADKVGQLLPGVVDRERVERLVPTITVTRL